MQKLYLVHCGFYDPAICDGIYEGHVNLFVAAGDFDEAKRRVRLNPVFQLKRMHVDGVQEIAAVDGHRVSVVADPALDGR